jgi:hypothetical protein
MTEEEHKALVPLPTAALERLVGLLNRLNAAHYIKKDLQSFLPTRGRPCPSPTLLLQSCTSEPRAGGALRGYQFARMPDHGVRAVGLPVELAACWKLVRLRHRLTGNDYDECAARGHAPAAQAQSRRSFPACPRRCEAYRRWRVEG